MPGAKLSISTSVPFAAIWIRQSRGQKVCSRMNSVSTATKGAWPSLTQASASSSLREISFMGADIAQACARGQGALSVRALVLRSVCPKRAANREQRQRDRASIGHARGIRRLGIEFCTQDESVIRLARRGRSHHAVKRGFSLFEARHSMHKRRHNRTERDEPGESPSSEGSCVLTGGRSGILFSLVGAER